MSHIYPHGWHRDAVSRQHDNDIKSPAAKEFLILRQIRRQGEGRGAKPDARSTKPETSPETKNGQIQNRAADFPFSSLGFEFVSGFVLRNSCLPPGPSPPLLTSPVPETPAAPGSRPGRSRRAC